MSTDEESRFGELSFVYNMGNDADHKPDRLGAGEGAEVVLYDQTGNDDRVRGVLYIDDYRTYIQSVSTVNFRQTGNGDRTEFINDIINALYGPIITVSPDSLDFGTVLVNSGENLTLTISNEGNDVLTVSDISVEGDCFSTDFEQEYDLDPDDESELTVTFEPTATGDFEGFVTITSSDPFYGELSVYICGTGAAPEIALSPDSLNFGDVQVDDSVEQDFYIGNHGQIGLTVSEIYIDGNHFNVDFGGEFTVEANDSTPITVTFNPAQEGEFTGEAFVVSNDPEQDTVSVILTGSGIISSPPEVVASLDDLELNEDFDQYEAADLDTVFSDPDEDELTFTTESNDENLSLDIDGENRLWISASPNWNGVADVVVQADDGFFDPVEDSFTVTVNPLNDDPVWDDVPPDTVVDETDEISFTLTADDVDLEFEGDNLTLSMFDDDGCGDAGANFTDNGDNSGSFSWQTGYEDAGVYNPVFRVEDDSGATADVSVQITIDDLNRAPVLDEVGDQSVDPGNELIITLTANDPDDDSLTYSAENMPEGAGLNDNVFSWTPDGDQSGYYDVTFRVTDDGEPNLSDDETITISVGDVNHPPALDEIGNREVDEGEELAFTLTATDPDDEDSLTFSAEDLPDGASLDNVDFSWTPDYDQAGDHQVTFRVTDDGDPNFSDEETITISVIDVNRPPQLTEINDIEIDETEEFTLTLQASDPDGDNLALAAFNLPMGAELNDSLFSWTPGYDQSGEYEVTFRATDDGEPNLFDEDTVTITVNNVNRPPVLSEIGDREIDEGQNLSISLEADDPDGDSLSFTAENLPAGATLEDDLFTWTPDFDQAGDHDVTFRVSDNGDPNLFDEETVTITVADVNRPPVLAAIGSQNIDENEELTITLSADDPDGDNLTFSAQNLPIGATLDDSVFSWTPNYDQYGNYMVIFRVTDDGDPNLMDSEMVMISVHDINRSPVLAAIGDLEIDEDEDFTLQLAADDPDDDNLSFEAENLPDGATLDGDVFSWRPDYNQSGVYGNVLFRVLDDGQPVMSDEETITITVNNVNLMPVLSYIGDQTISEGEDFTLQLEATDYDNDNLTFSADNLPEGATLEDDLFSWTPGYNQAGDYDVTFRVTDDGEPNLHDEETITITVINENQAPVLTHVDDQQVDENEELIISLSADDPDGDNLTYTAQNLPEGSRLTGVEFSWTPGYNQAGDYDVTFRVTDDGEPNLYDEQTVGITVNNVNRPPALTEIADQTVDEGEEFTLQLEADDPDGDNLAFSADDLPEGATLEDNLFSWTPDFDQAGDFDITFRVTDDGTPNLSDEEAVTITVENLNRPPVLAEIDNYTTNENTALEFTLSADDPDGDNLTFSAENMPAGAELDGPDFNWTPGYDQAGIYHVTFRATDDGEPNLYDDEIVTITVNNVNRPPVLSEVGDQTINEAEEFTLQLEAADPDGDNLSFEAENLPEGAELVNNSFLWTPTYDQASRYDNIVFRVTDDGEPELSDGETISITVNDVNRPPLWDYIPQSASINENQLLEFTVRGSDPDGDDVTLSASSDDLPDGWEFTDNEDGTGLFSWRPGNDDGGLYRAVFTISDGDFNEPETVIITVGDINRPPIWDDFARNREIDETEQLQFTVTGSDPDGDDVTIVYSSEDIPEAAEFSDNGDGTGTFTWTPSYDDAGEYGAEFIISDEEFDISVDVSITVNNVNRPPLLSDIGDLEIDEDEELTLQLEASDPDQDLFSFSAENLPDGANVAGNTFSWTPTYDQAGVYGNVIFRVTDNGEPNLSDEETISITVHNVNRAPALAEVGAREVDENSSLEFTLSAEDPDGDQVTYSAENLPEGAALEDGHFNWTPSFDQAGDYEVTFRATDDGEPNMSDEEAVTISVLNVNRPPQLADIGDLSLREGERFTLQLEAGDPDNDNLAFSADNLPAGASLEDGLFSWTPDNDQAGVYENVTFRVTDDGDPNLSDEETVTITVGNVNRPPAFAEMSDMDVDEGGRLEFTLSAEDPDGDELTYSGSNLPAGAELDGAAFNWTPGYDQAGEYRVTFMVTDNGSPRLSDEASIIITVNNVNRTPVLADIGDLEIDEGEQFSLQLEAEDPDGDNLSFEADNLPEGAALEDGVFSWTPEYDRSGEYGVTFRVTDDGDPNLSDEETVTITVLNVNRPPVLSNIDDREINEGADLQFSLTATDPDGDELTFSAQYLPTGAVLEGASFNWTPEYDQSGEYNVTFRATDNGDPNLFDEETITITVLNINRPPALAEIGNRQVDADNELVIALSAEDPDEDELTYSVEGLPEGASLEENIFRWTPDFDQTGNHQVTFRVADNGEPQLTDEETVIITVGDVNRPPVLSGIGDREVDENAELLITLSAEDPDGDDLTFNAVDQPEGAELDGAEFRWTPGFDQAGEYRVTFRVTDDGDPNLSDEETITITVHNINRTPVLAEIGDQEIEEGGELNIELDAEDPDGDSLRFAAYNLPEGAELEDNFLNWTPDFEQAGEYQVTLRVTDDGDPNLSDEEMISITVYNVNRPPVLADIGDREVDEDELLTISLAAEDPDGNNLTFSAENLPGGAGMEGAGFSWRPGFDQSGEYRVVFVVTDDGNPELSDRESIIISVNNVNRPPELEGSIENVAINEDPDPRRVDIADLDSVFMDPDDDELTFNISPDNLPDELNLGIDMDNVLFIEPDDNYNLVDEIEITIAASDDDRNALMASRSRTRSNSLRTVPAGPVRSARMTIAQATRRPDDSAGFGRKWFTLSDARRDDVVQESFTLTINPVNDPPEWVDVPEDQEIREEGLIRFTLAAWDVDLDNEGDELHLSMIEDDGTADRGARFEDNGDNSGSFTWQTSVEDTGEYDPVFQVLDEGDAAAELSVHIIISPANRPPVVDHPIRNIQIEEDPDPRHVEIADLDSVFYDPDEDTLSYEFAGAPADINMEIDEDNILFFAPDQDYNLQAGALIVITAQDRAGAAATDTFRVVIDPVNDRPAAFSLLAPIDRSVIESAVDEVTFTWEEADDVDGDELSYTLFLQTSWDGFDTTVSRSDLPAAEFTVEDVHGLMVEFGWTPGGVNRVEITWWVEASDGELSVESSERWSLIVEMPTSIRSIEEQPPVEFSLSRNYPNPFNPSTRIDIVLPHTAEVRLSVSDASGRLLAVLLSGQLPAGRHSVSWVAHDLATGLYIFTLEAEGRRLTTQGLLIR